jgi:hypothetical protein
MICEGFHYYKKKEALAGDEVQVRVLKVLLPLALLQHDGKTLHYKFPFFVAMINQLSRG